MNDFIFFALILLISASTGNSLKCYNCTTLEDKFDCDHPTIDEKSDTESVRQVCLTIELTTSNNSKSIPTIRKLFSLPSAKNTTEACELFKNILTISEKFKVSEKRPMLQVLNKCVSCNADLCNAPPAPPQQPSSKSTPETSSSISIRLQQSSIGVAMAGILLNFYKMHSL